MLNKKNLITIGIIIGVILLEVGILYFKSIKTNNPSEEIVKCICKKATLYVSTGCPHCLTQQGFFGDNLELLNIVNCFENNTLCVEEGITNVPTWIINGKRIKGTYSIEELKDMTKC